MSKEEFVHHADLVGFDAWLRAAHHSTPDWFPSDSREVNIAWGEFALNDNGITAIHAVDAIVGAGLVLPDALVPWVTGACEIWRGEAAGNKREVKKIKTSESLADDYEAIYSLQMRGMSKRKACRVVAGISGRTEQTLYDTRKYQATVDQVKAGIHHSLLLVHLRLIGDGRHEDADAFAQDFPGFFDTDLATQTLDKYHRTTVKLNQSQ